MLVFQKALAQSTLFVGTGRIFLNSSTFLGILSEGTFLSPFFSRGGRLLMESHERELIERVRETNFEVKKLYQQHQELEDRLKKLGRQAFLTSAEEAEERKLKQLKLRGVERMLKLAAG